jgi:hypothetical protein
MFLRYRLFSTQNIGYTIYVEISLNLLILEKSIHKTKVFLS